jgi:hypothetical protein
VAEDMTPVDDSMNDPGTADTTDPATADLDDQNLGNIDDDPGE